MLAPVACRPAVAAFLGCRRSLKFAVRSRRGGLALYKRVKTSSSARTSSVKWGLDTKNLHLARELLSAGPCVIPFSSPRPPSPASRSTRAEAATNPPRAPTTASTPRKKPVTPRTEPKTRPTRPRTRPKTPRATQTRPNRTLSSRVLAPRAAISGKLLRATSIDRAARVPRYSGSHTPSRLAAFSRLTGTSSCSSAMAGTSPLTRRIGGTAKGVHEPAWDDAAPGLKGRETQGLLVHVRRYGQPNRGERPPTDLEGASSFETKRNRGLLDALGERSVPRDAGSGSLLPCIRGEGLESKLDVFRVPHVERTHRPITIRQ